MCHWRSASTRTSTNSGR
uniref:Uncharacterized protein n=1 Tax=Anguilla anguilla TaxID=7936 RepID=A0A0E9P7K3_ANGAN